MKLLIILAGGWIGGVLAVFFLLMDWYIYEKIAGISWNPFRKEK
jgi:hypothetical protein